MSSPPVDKEKLYPIAAYANQGSPTYQGGDLWGYTVLPKGTKLVQLDYDPERLSKTQTASQFFTTTEEMAKHRDPHTGKVDTAQLSERIQVMAFRFNPGDEFQHSPQVTVYDVVEDMPVAYAKVTDNPAFGRGGADQYFSLVDKKDLIRQHREATSETGEKSLETIGYLKPVAVIEASNRIPTRQLYSAIEQAEAQGVTNPEKKIIGAEHLSYKQALHNSGDPTAIERLTGMDEREAFTKEARDMVATLDWQGMKDAALPQPRTAVEKLEYGMGAVRNPDRRAEIGKLINEVKNQKVASVMRGANQNENTPKSNGPQAGRNERPERAKPDRDKDIDIGD